ncbi:MAG: hypothetical protein JWN43_4220, partial [Gammaproteobacteria bacterium]|nr:hypothetical protein [Gammaproteobacteria bacterium]
MKLLARLFPKAPSPPPTLQERITMLGAASPDFVLSTALSTEDEALRVAAVHRMSDGVALRRLAGSSTGDGGAAVDSPAALVQAAQARLAELIDTGSVDFAEFCQTAIPPVMFSVAALSKDTTRLPTALASIDDPARVAQLVVESPYSRLRQLAAQRVEDPAELKRLLRLVGGKDKNVYKILKQKCDALNADKRKEAEFANDVSGLSASLEWHSHRTYDSFYTSIFEQLNTRWCALAPRMDAHTEQRGAQAIVRCREVIEAHQREVAQRTASQVAQRAAQVARELEQQAAREAASARADAEAQARQEASAAREAAEAVRAEKRNAEEQAFRQIGGLIRKAHDALSNGNKQQSAGLRRAIAE